MVGIKATTPRISLPEWLGACALGVPGLALVGDRVCRRTPKGRGKADRRFQVSSHEREAMKLQRSMPKSSQEATQKQL